MTRLALPQRKGMVLAELLIGMIVLALVGIALIGTLRSQARYFDNQKTATLARAVARAPINRVVSDIRMVEAMGGVTAASSTSITFRVPFAMGVVCGLGPNAQHTHISLLPVDSAMFAEEGYSGYAWRGGNGVYRYKDDNGGKATGDLSVCQTWNIATLTSDGAKIIKISPPLPDTASYGTPVFLYRKIKYSLAASTLVPGTTGLYRTVMETNKVEELAAPYTGSSKFRFYVGSSVTAQDSPPADLTTLRGIEINLTATSERPARGQTAKKSIPFVTSVFFKNRLD